MTKPSSCLNLDGHVAGGTAFILRPPCPPVDIKLETMPRKRLQDEKPEESRRTGRKAKHEGSASTQAAAEEEAKPADWRSLLYFFHGTVQTNLSSGETHWQGTWVASSDGLPSPAEFDESPNKFNLVSTSFLARDEVALEDACPFGRSGDFKGRFSLDDDGSGTHREVSDIEHRVVFKACPGGCSLVGARGLAPFGQFVSLGRLTCPSRNVPAQLTLARQYIGMDDPRVQLSAWAALLRAEARLTKGRRDAWETPWSQMSQIGADLTVREAQRKCCQTLVRTRLPRAAHGCRMHGATSRCMHALGRFPDHPRMSSFDSRFIGFVTGGCRRRLWV